MTRSISRRQVVAGSILALPPLAASPARAQAARAQIRRILDEAVRPLMEQHAIPGMAVAATTGGERHVGTYGIASRESGQPVTADTLFELGSVSKTFTATLAGLAAARGALSLTDPASRHLPALAGSSFDRISLLNLGTYTAGGLPLQFPAGVADHATMIDFLRSWRPRFAPGTHRLYSNPSIGLFGHLAARSLGRPFDDLMEQELFPALGLTRSYIRVPAERMGDYAFGYGSDNRPIRVAPGMLASEAYGVKTSAAEMIRFLEVNLDPSTLGAELQRAIAATHIGYFRSGVMTQGLGWELYAAPTPLDRLLAGNSSHMIFNPNEVTRPAAREESVLLNKTGSTNGFGAYVALVPSRRIGLVMLANRNYPIPDRIRAAHQILTALER